MGHAHEHLEFDSDLGFSGMNRDVQVSEADAEDRRAVAEMAGSPDAPSIINAADELVTDELAALKQRIREHLAGRGIACRIAAGRMVLDSDLSNGIQPASYSVTLYLAKTVTLGASGYTVAECEEDAMQKLAAMLDNAAPFRIVPQQSDGPCAA